VGDSGSSRVLVSELRSTSQGENTLFARRVNGEPSGSALSIGDRPNPRVANQFGRRSRAEARPSRGGRGCAVQKLRGRRGDRNPLKGREFGGSRRTREAVKKKKCAARKKDCTTRKGIARREKRKSSTTREASRAARDEDKAPACAVWVVLREPAN
jgi:hypothetical protein